MHIRFGAVGVLAALLVVWTLAMPSHPMSLAQEATPESAGLPEGVSLEVVAIGAAEKLPPAPAMLAIFRARFEPGASFVVPADDPDSGLFVVESGTLTVSSTVPVVVTRAGELAATEQIAADVEFTLGPGDSFVSPPESGGEFRNDGQEPVVMLIAAIQVTPAA